MSTSFWKNKVCLITGGTAGFGLALTRQFVAEQAQVVVVARNLATWEQVSNQLELPRTSFVSADVTKPESAVSAVEQVVARHGGLDWLINNVGASTRFDIRSGNSEAFHESMRINFESAVNMTQAALATLCERRGGVINIASAAGRTPWAWIAPYVCSKAALAAYSDQLRFEVSELTTVLTVLSGPIRRDDAWKRYASEAAGLPSAAGGPGAGAPLKGLDPDWLAKRVVNAAASGRREVIEPAKVRWLYRLRRLSPRLAEWLTKKYVS